mgnify:CR=1 FL=1
MNIEQELISYFRDITSEEVLCETQLIENRIIDSMGVLELLAFIDMKYDLNLDMEDLTIENFATINNIKNLILSKRRELE